MTNTKPQLCKPSTKKTKTKIKLKIARRHPQQTTATQWILKRPVWAITTPSNKPQMFKPSKTKVRSQNVNAHSKSLYAEKNIDAQISKKRIKNMCQLDKLHWHSKLIHINKPTCIVNQTKKKHSNARKWKRSTACSLNRSLNRKHPLQQSIQVEQKNSCKLSLDQTIQKKNNQRKIKPSFDQSIQD